MREVALAGSDACYIWEAGPSYPMGESDSEKKSDVLQEQHTPESTFDNDSAKEVENSEFQVQQSCAYL